MNSKIKFWRGFLALCAFVVIVVFPISYKIHQNYIRNYLLNTRLVTVARELKYIWKNQDKWPNIIILIYKENGEFKFLLNKTKNTFEITVVSRKHNLYYRKFRIIHKDKLLPSENIKSIPSSDPRLTSCRVDESIMPASGNIELHLEREGEGWVLRTR